MKSFVIWLEEDNRRLRKVLALFTAVVWLLSVIISYTLYTFKYDTLAILALVTTQFTAVIGFYMSTKAESD